MLFKDQNSGYDSLLDTMTNAVGVLIIVLAVSYLTLRDTVDQIMRFEPDVSQTNRESYRQLQAQNDQLDMRLEQLKLEWKNLSYKTAVKISRHDQERLRSRKLLEYAQTDYFDKFEIKPVIISLQENQNKIRKMESEIDTLKYRSGRLLQTISKQFAAPKPKITIAHVPDPVPVPVNLTRNVYLCRYGRILLYPEKEMNALLEEAVQQVLNINPNNPQVGLNNYSQIIDYFNDNQIGQNGLKWKIRVLQKIDSMGDVYRQLHATVQWTSIETGENLQRIQSQKSFYRSDCNSKSLKDQYIQYYVWEDSFPEYVVAREIADEYEIPAGWIAKTNDDELTVVLHSRKTASNSIVNNQNIPSSAPNPVRFRLGSGIGTLASRSAPGYRSSSSGQSFRVSGTSRGADYID